MQESHVATTPLPPTLFTQDRTSRSRRSSRRLHRASPRRRGRAYRSSLDEEERKEEMIQALKERGQNRLKTYQDGFAEFLLAKGDWHQGVYFEYRNQEHIEHIIDATVGQWRYQLEHTRQNSDPADPQRPLIVKMTLSGSTFQLERHSSDTQEVTVDNVIDTLHEKFRYSTLYESPATRDVGTSPTRPGNTPIFSMEPLGPPPPVQLPSSFMQKK